MVLNDAKDKFVSARISLGAVGPTPLFANVAGDALAGDALAGQPINDETIAKAAAAAKAIAKPITDMRGTAEFRTHITGVLVERVLKPPSREPKASTSIVELGINLSSSA